MAYEKTIWKNREVERPRTFTKVENPDGTITLVPAEGNIIEQGTPIIAQNMNNIEQGIVDAHDLAQQAFQSASDGKTIIASSITAKGVPANNQDTFPTLANKINQIETDPSIGKTDAAAGDIIKGKKAVSQGSLLTGTLELTGNALLTHVLAGNTFYNTDAKTKRTGTMTNRGAVNQAITTQGGQYIVPEGFHSGSGKVTATFANLVAGNIKSGVNIGGVVGTLPSAVIVPINVTESVTATSSTSQNRTIKLLTLPQCSHVFFINTASSVSSTSSHDYTSSTWGHGSIRFPNNAPLLYHHANTSYYDKSITLYNASVWRVGGTTSFHFIGQNARWSDGLSIVYYPYTSTTAQDISGDVNIYIQSNSISNSTVTTTMKLTGFIVYIPV